MSEKVEVTNGSEHLRSVVEGTLRQFEARERQLGMIPVALSVGLAPGSSESENGPQNHILVVMVGVCDRATVREDVHRELDSALANLAAKYN